MAIFSVNWHIPRITSVHLIFKWAKHGRAHLTPTLLRTSSLFFVTIVIVLATSSNNRSPWIGYQFTRVQTVHWTAKNTKTLKKTPVTTFHQSTIKSPLTTSSIRTIFNKPTLKKRFKENPCLNSFFQFAVQLVFSSL